MFKKGSIEPFVVGFVWTTTMDRLGPLREGQVWRGAANDRYRAGCSFPAGNRTARTHFRFSQTATKRHVDAPVDARGFSNVEACDRCVHVSGLAVAALHMGRGPVWRCADQVRIRFASSWLRTLDCFSWSRSCRSFALSVRGPSSHPRRTGERQLDRRSS